MLCLNVYLRGMRTSARAERKSSTRAELCLSAAAVAAAAAAAVVAAAVVAAAAAAAAAAAHPLRAVVGCCCCCCCTVARTLGVALSHARPAGVRAACVSCPRRRYRHGQLVGDVVCPHQSDGAGAWCVCVWCWSSSSAGSGGAGRCQRVMERSQSGRYGLATAGANCVGCRKLAGSGGILLVEFQRTVLGLRKI